jgi:hypothetical protein
MRDKIYENWAKCDPVLRKSLLEALTIPELKLMGSYFDYPLRGKKSEIVHQLIGYFKSNDNWKAIAK